MTKPESNAKQVFISSAHRIGVVPLIEKYRSNKGRLMLCITTDEQSAILSHQNTLEIIFTALNVPIPV